MFRYIIYGLAVITGSFIMGCADTCDPACRDGYACVSDSCVTICNPDCGSGETCNPASGQCETTEDTATTAFSIEPADKALEPTLEGSLEPDDPEETAENQNSNDSQ